MFSTLVLVSLFIGILLLSSIAWGFFLWLGLRWSNVSDISVRRIAVTTAMVVILQGIFNFVVLLPLPSAVRESLPGAIIQTCVAIIFQIGVIMAVCKLPIRKVAQAWLLTLFASTATVVFGIFIIRPALYDAFLIPTNAMAPTIIGTHMENVCATCNEKNYGSIVSDRSGAGELPRMICERFHVGPTANKDGVSLEGDRILVAKFLKLQRWDIIAYRLPSQPNILDVKRIVGMPGETIEIRDGCVWVNGQELSVPENLDGLEYLDAIPELPQITLWGSANRPATLARDEYFVLGDFSAQSADSRVWESGAANHNPFAVPQSHIIGVVTHTFWPPNRVRIHR